MLSKLKEEVQTAFALTLYFGSWFCALAFLAATSLDERPIPLSIFGFAIIKAAVCAKFLMVGQMVFPIKVSKNHGIVSSLILESVVYLLIVLSLNYIEAGVHGLIHGKEFIPSMAEFGKSNPLRVVAMCIVYWLIVWPYLLYCGLKLSLGNVATIELLFGPRKKTQS